MNRHVPVILRWSLIALVVFALTTLIGGHIAATNLPKIYAATAQAQVVTRVVPGAFAPSASAVANEIVVMKSSTVLLPVIKQLGLDKTWAQRCSKSGQGSLSDWEALDYMSKVLKFDYVPGTNVITITATSEVPQEAAEIANAVADKNQTSPPAADAGAPTPLPDPGIPPKPVVADQKIAPQNTARDTLKKGSAAAPGILERMRLEFERCKKSLLAAKANYDERRISLEHAIKLRDDQLIAKLENLGQGADVATQKTEYTKKQTDIGTLLKNGAKPDDSRIVTLRKQLDDMAAGIRRALQADADMAKSRVAQIQKQMQDLTTRLSGDHTPGLQALHEAESELGLRKKPTDALDARLQLAASQLQAAPIQVIGHAGVPTVPVPAPGTPGFSARMLSAAVLSILVASFVELVIFLSHAFGRARN